MVRSIVINISWVFGAAILSYFILSIRFFAPDTLAVIYRLGKPLKVVGPGGFSWVLLFIDSARILPTGNIRITIPTKKERIVKDDTKELKPGEMRPLHINHKSSESAMYWKHRDRDDLDSPMELIPYRLLKDWERNAIADDSMESAITTEVIAHVDISIGKMIDDPTLPKDSGKKIYDPQSLFDFVKNVQTPEKAAERIAGTGRSALVELLSPLTARNAADVKGHIEGLIKDRMEILVGEKEKLSNGQQPKFENPWGVNIVATEIEEFELGKTVNQARAGEAAAVSDRKNKKQATEAAVYEIREKGKADGDADRERGRGRADAISEVALAMQEDGAEFAAVLETTEKVAEKANFIIAPENGGLAATITAIASGTMDALKKDNKSVRK